MPDSDQHSQFLGMLIQNILVSTFASVWLFGPLHIPASIFDEKLQVRKSRLSEFRYYN